MKDGGPYDFLEWHKLSLYTRADLIPLVEGLRSGAMVDSDLMAQWGPEYFASQKRCLEFCLRKFGLIFRRDKDGDYFVTRDKALLDRLWHGEVRIGDFLGYPKCCVDAFCKNTCAASDFYRKMAAAIGKKHSGHILFYVRHVPCGLNCKKSLALGYKMKSVLERDDIEAAYYLEESKRNTMYHSSYFHNF